MWPTRALRLHEFEMVVNVPSGNILNPGACCSKTYAFKSSGSLAVTDGLRPATFGVLELPSMRLKVYRALDGERVFGTSPDRPRLRSPIFRPPISASFVGT